MTKKMLSLASAHAICHLSRLVGKAFSEEKREIPVMMTELLVMAL